MLDAGKIKRRQDRLAAELERGRPEIVLPQVHEIPAVVPPVEEYRVVSVEMNHLVCHTWDGETEGEQDINVALRWELRRSVWDYAKNGGKRDELGRKLVYTDAIHWERTSFIGEGEEETEEDQLIIPAYLTENKEGQIGPTVILACRLSTPLVLPIYEPPEDTIIVYLIDVTQRAFTQKYEEP